MCGLSTKRRNADVITLQTRGFYPMNLKIFKNSQAIVVGFAIFAMLFGAGNLIFPLYVGLSSGANNIVPAMAGLLLTSVLLPFIGLVTIMLFDGDYRAFFYRVGRVPGNLLIFMCMLFIGPFVVLPRIVTLTYTLLRPFLPIDSIALFSIFFLTATFFVAFRENKIIKLLGYVLTPIKLFILLSVIIAGMMLRGTLIYSTQAAWPVFVDALKEGLLTFDLLGAIFFGAIIVTLLKREAKDDSRQTVNQIVRTGLKAGVLGCSILAIVYLGMGLIGMRHGAGLSVNAAELFSLVSIRILGSWAGFLIAVGVLLACWSTVISLSVVVGEYLAEDICRKKIKYPVALALVLVLTYIFSLLGFDMIMIISKRFVVQIGLPIVITITFANLAYKLFGFKSIKTPVALVAIASVGLFFINLFSQYCW
jgi:LIVCS family branched-chain amino acid:cation transporter